MAIRKGQTVRVRCTIQPGPFSGEKLITVQTCEGPISGFVGVEYLELADQPNGFVVGRVMGVKPDRIVVRLQGAFFTTNGLAAVLADSLKLAA